MRYFVIALATAVLALASDRSGLRPRPQPTDYAAHEAGREVEIGAAALTPDQVKSLFSTDMSQYTVLEVGVYPAAGKTVEVATADFALRVGAQGEVVRAANPDAIATSIQRKNTPPPPRSSDVTIYPTATVGVASGTDPLTGRREHGVYTETGVGVAIGDPGYPQPPRPGSTDRDRDVMHQELTDKTLPNGKSSVPVAGYLYFRLPPKARTSALELQYYTADGKVRVLLPALKK